MNTVDVKQPAITLRTPTPALGCAPPTVAELRNLLRALGLGARDLLRTSEAAYTERGLADSALCDTALLEAMTAEPRLIQRPIAVSGQHAVLGRPPEKVLELLP